MPNPAVIAYEAYCQSTGGVSLISGEKLPSWFQLNPEIQKAWMEAAQAVIRNIRPYEPTIVGPTLLTDSQDMIIDNYPDYSEEEDIGKYPNFSPNLNRPGASD